MARPLRLDGLVVWHSGDGDCDGRVWKDKVRPSDSGPLLLLLLLPLEDAGQPTWGGELAPFVLGQLEDVEGPLDHLDLVLHPSIVQWCYGVSSLDLVSAARTNSRTTTVIRTSSY